MRIITAEPRGFSDTIARMSLPATGRAAAEVLAELEHLRANDVDLSTVQVVKGPLLKFDNKTEMFVGSDQVLVDAANKNPLHKRTGRGAFSIQQIA